MVSFDVLRRVHAASNDPPNEVKTVEIKQNFEIEPQKGKRIFEKFMIIWENSSTFLKEKLKQNLGENSS